MDLLVLRHSTVFFGNRDRIHIWLTWHDYKNASLMILLAYILVGHPDWKHAEMFDRFVASAEHIIMRTSIGRAPWIIVEGVDERYRSLKVGTEILAANTLKEMQRVHSLDPNLETTRGLGFSVLRRDGTTFV